MLERLTELLTPEVVQAALSALAGGAIAVTGWLTPRAWRWLFKTTTLAGSSPRPSCGSCEGAPAGWPARSTHGSRRSPGRKPCCGSRRR